MYVPPYPLSLTKTCNSFKNVNAPALQCNEDLDMVIKRLETEANQTREAARAETQREAAAAVESRARELATAQEQETRAMERCVLTAQ